MLIILMNDIKSSAPVTNNLNAIDEYYAACVLHVFGAIIEYATILLLMKLLDVSEKRTQNRNIFGENKSSTSKARIDVLPALEEPHKQTKKTSMLKKGWNSSIIYSLVIVYAKIDWISLLVFPLIFITYNARYWAHYL